IHRTSRRHSLEPIHVPRHIFAMQQTSRAVSVTASVLAAACSTGSDENLGVTRDTLPNGAVSIHYAALPDNSIDSLTPNITIGAVDGEPHEIFGDIRGVAIGAGGDVYILDYQAAEVCAFVRMSGHDGRRQASRPNADPA